jgi:hypothetical protein
LDIQKAFFGTGNYVNFKTDGINLIVMELLSQIDIARAQGLTSIQLLQGDLSAIPAEQATDILVMSAFPGTYIALKNSLIDALDEKGLSVEALAQDKEVDLRKQLYCWLSKPLSAAEQTRFNFKRILCFEPGEKIQEPEEVVGDIFRCINTFAFDEDKNELAMPIIATGYQKIPMQKILPALLNAAYFWLSNGLPIISLKLVVYHAEQAMEALPLFNKFKASIQPVNIGRGTEPQARSQQEKKNKIFKNSTKDGSAEVTAPPPSKKSFDYFLSYAHVHANQIQYFVDELKKKNKDLSVFYDKDSIAPGGLWIKEISAAIQQSDKVLVFLSPDYDKSPVCWDEFQCAKLLEYNRKKPVIQTIYLFGYKETEMPLMMGIYSYLDCREGSTKKIAASIQQLLK